jgi:hypothetical protein
MEKYFHLVYRTNTSGIFGVFLKKDRPRIKNLNGTSCDIAAIAGTGAFIHFNDIIRSNNPNNNNDFDNKNYLSKPHISGK